MGSFRGILNRRWAGVMLAVSSGLLFLSACALPPSVQIASWVADGISYVVTQKSLTDHGISFLAQRDCALWRGVKGEAICRDPDTGAFAVASGNGGKTPDIKRGGKTPDEPFAVPVRAAPWATAVVAGQRRRGRAPKAIRAEPVAQSGLFYVIGSFRDPDNAFGMAKRLAALTPDVVTPRGGGIYRVIVGPFTDKNLRKGRRGIRRSGVAGAWPVYLDPSEWNIAEKRESNTVRRLSEAPLFSGGGAS